MGLSVKFLDLEPLGIAQRPGVSHDTVTLFNIIIEVSMQEGDG